MVGRHATAGEYALLGDFGYAAGKANAVGVSDATKRPLGGRLVATTNNTGVYDGGVNVCDLVAIKVHGDLPVVTCC